MRKLSDTYKELGIAYSFPIEIRNSNFKETYYEDSDDYCHRYEYDANGNKIYYEDSNGNWFRYEYDSNGKETYYEDNDGVKFGTPRSQSCDGKVIEVDGKKYKLTEL